MRSAHPVLLVDLEGSAIPIMSLPVIDEYILEKNPLTDSFSHNDLGTCWKVIHSCFPSVLPHLFGLKLTLY